MKYDEGKILAKSLKKHIFWQTGVVALIDSNDEVESQCLIVITVTFMARTQLLTLSVQKMETDVQPTNHVAGQFDLEYFTYKPKPRRKI